ncbi:hypothetical protein ACWDYJ_23730 [Streptomyces sp. NPDC003042]
MRKRATALLAATAVFTGTALTMGASTASAAPTFTFYATPDGGKDFTIRVYNNGKLAGGGYWTADPIAGIQTGDTLVAWDGLADGYGITAHLSTGRVASTRGSNAPAHEAVTGNLPEGNAYNMWVCVVKDGYRNCSGSYTIRA